MSCRGSAEYLIFHKPMTISHSRPSITGDELTVLKRIILSGGLAEGIETDAFEKEMAAFVSRCYGVATSSGTAALHLSLTALDIGKEDEVIIPDYICSALLYAVLLCGAEPVFCEPSKETLNIQPENIERLITKRTKAIIVPHIFGLPAPVDRITEFDIPVIEDCAHTLGTKITVHPVGSLGVASIFSFYATKFLSAGAGGLVATDDPVIADRVRDLKSYDKKENYQLRYNYQWTDIQASLARSQLSRIDRFIQRRQHIAGVYRRALNEAEDILAFPPDKPEHVYYRFVVTLRTNVDEVIPLFEADGINARKPVFQCLHRYRNLPGRKYPISDWCERHCLSLPIYPSLTDSEVETVVSTARRLLGGS